MHNELDNLLDLELEAETLEMEEVESASLDSEDEEEYIKLDYTLNSPEERNELVKKVIAATPPEKLTQKYIESLSNYIVFAMDKQERKEKKILTDNRMVTVNKRETSFEGLTGRLENGEDGIYNMIANDKNIIFSPNVTITKKDLEEIAPLRELREKIDELEIRVKSAKGKQAYLLRKQLIEMRQDQYVIKNAYRKPIYCMNKIKSVSKLNLEEKIWVDEKGNVQSEGIINLYNPDHISILLCNYAKLKEDSHDKLMSDAKWLITDLEDLVDKSLKEMHPLYYDLVICKIDGMQNHDIQSFLEQKHNVYHSVEYISSLWRNKIPKIIAEFAQNEWLVWHYTFEEKGTWKKCSRCGQIKLAHNHFFSKNKTSKDGYYSICKACRNKKPSK